MSQPLQAIRGMSDIVPADMPYWQLLESCCQDLMLRYGYQELRFPIVEKTELFSRTIGEVTDIIEKEMYTFTDRNGDSLSLRPEGTAGCVRAGIQQGLLYNQTQRLWYLGPMFRHERPQKGRYRQFYQWGVEAFGMAGPEVEAEQMILFWRLLNMLELSQQVVLEINTLGSQDCRQRYREQLLAYFQSHIDVLDEDSKRRLDTNPLRILDSKHPEMQTLIAAAPSIESVLSDESTAHFERLQQLLTQAEVPFRCQPRLVRGLDYYCHTVYEWTTESLGAQGTVCAGGRYDCLVENLGGKATPAVGFAMGLERMVLMMQQCFECSCSPDVYCVLVGEDALAQGLLLAEYVRDNLPQLSVVVNTQVASMKNQFKRADASGARWAVVMGDDECASQTVTIKSLRDRAVEQETLTWEQLLDYLQENN